MYEKEFRKRLAELRENKGMSARDMSLSIGQNAGYINGIETGKSLPSMPAFFYICDFLGIEPKDFFDTDLKYPEKLTLLIEELRKLSDTQLDSIITVVHELVDKK